jgi:murein tripeptide amidase MpaA
LASPAARAATPAQVEQCVTAWASAAPNRVRVVEYARSHEGRALRYVIVTAPRNLWRLDEIQAGLAKLGDPRHVNDAEARESIERLPAVAWLAYTMHGDETEGSDAALAILYHLLASEDPPVEQLLQDVVMILDPLMNPDGRERFATMIAEHGSR